MSAEQPAEDEVYQVQLDKWAATLAAAATDLISDPIEAAGVLMQAAMMASLKSISLEAYAQAQLVAAQDLYGEIMGPVGKALH